jgi:hypothetical protein
LLANPIREGITKWYVKFFYWSLWFFNDRIEYFNVHYISKLQYWICQGSLDTTNNLVERFNLHVKAVLFNGHSCNKTTSVIETFGNILHIQEVQLLPPITSSELSEVSFIFLFWMDFFQKKLGWWSYSY